MYENKIIDYFVKSNMDIIIRSWGECPICEKEGDLTLSLYYGDNTWQFHCENCVPTSFTPYHLSLDEGIELLTRIIKKMEEDR